MMQGSYYTHMYNNFSEIQYSFEEFAPIPAAPEKDDDQIKEEPVHDLEAGTVPVPAAPEKKEEKKEIKIPDEKDGAGGGAGSIFGPIDDIKKSI